MKLGLQNSLFLLKYPKQLPATSSSPLRYEANAGNPQKDKVQ